MKTLKQLQDEYKDVLDGRGRGKRKYALCFTKDGHCHSWWRVAKDSYTRRT